MRKPLRLVLLSITIVLFFASCAASNEHKYERKAALLQARVDAAPCFVQMNDGTIHHYNSLQLITRVYTAPHLLADGKVKIFPNEIFAYQNDRHFAVSAAGFSYGGHKSNLAVETLPGFAVRIASGHLNVYVKKFKVGNVVRDEYFFQEGNGQVLAYTPELMDALIKNSPEALDFFNNHRKHIRLTKELKYTASIFNDAYFNREGGVSPALVASAGKRKPKR